MNYLKENVPVKTFKAILYNEMRLHDTTQQYNMCPAKLRKTYITYTIQCTKIQCFNKTQKLGRIDRG